MASAQRTHVLGPEEAWAGTEPSTYLDAVVESPELRAVIDAALADAGAKMRGMADFVGFMRGVLAAVAQSPSPTFRAAAKAAGHRLDVLAEQQRQIRTAMGQDPTRIYWPNPERYPGQALVGNLPLGKAHPILDERTRVASAGSCFARQIAIALQHQGFNYMVEERLDEPGSGVRHQGPIENGHVAASAAWGTIYNCPSFLQLAEKAFGVKELPRLLLGPVDDWPEVPYADPFRQAVRFETVEAYERNYDRHVAACRRVLEKCEVFIMTLGLTEVWEHAPSGAVLSGILMSSSLVPFLRRRTLRFEENLDYLQRFSDLLKAHNPGVQIIVSVSPVPLIATHRAEDTHVITANCYSKAVLRAVAEQLSADNEHIHYFPSYEVVTQCAADPFGPDLRHIDASAVDDVMSLFSKMFVRGDGLEGFSKSDLERPAPTMSAP